MPYKYKKIIANLFLLLTWPFIILSNIKYKAFEKETVFQFSGQLLSLIPGKVGQYIRTSFYYYTIQSCMYDLRVGFGSFFAHPTASVGRRVVISAYSIIGTADIEDDVLISARVSILSGKYQHDIGQSAQGNLSLTRVCIRANTWIGENAIVMANIGSNCVVSAGSVVTRDMPDHRTAIGNPARFLDLKKGEKT